MRNTSLKLSILALAVAACLVIAPTASATTVSTNILANGSVVGSVSLSDTGTTCGVTLSTNQVCVDVAMTGADLIRVGGPVIGFAGNVNVGGTSTIIDVSGGFTLTASMTGCGGLSISGTLDICGTSTGSGTASTLTFVLTDAELSTGITVTGVHIIGPDCPGSTPSNPQTCFVGTGPAPTIPEPGTLGLLGTGLVGIAGLFRRRFLS